MNRKLLCILLFSSVLLAGCARSLADKPGFFDPAFHLRRTGGSAKELLTDTVFKALKIEVQYMKGKAPAEETLDNLKTFLTKHLHKSGGIYISTAEIPSAEDTVFSLQQIINIEDMYRTVFTRNDTLAVYVLFANGYYYNRQLLGHAYRNTSAVIFASHIQENAARYKKHSREYLESRVLLHEFGHLMGLVNVGAAVKSDHHDEENGKHCTNKHCLMYHLVDTDEYPLVLLKPAPPGFDKACLEDLKALGGKQPPARSRFMSK
jgi:predicted Zn-dependent protease